MELKIIHTGDLHLGMEFTKASFDNIHANKRRLELWETFERIVDRCKRVGAHFLLIAGDLFEEEYCTIGDIKRINSKLSEIADTRVIIVAGNHDTMGKRSLYKLIKWCDNVHIFFDNNISKFDFNDINTTVWGLSWNKKEEKVKLLEDLTIDDHGRINILVIHGDIFSSESQYLPIDKDSLLRVGFDYVALGHIHKPQMINDGLAYCGSPEPLDFGEQGEHGIVEGILSKDKINLEFTPFSKRVFCVKTINIDEEMTHQDIVNAVLECDTEEVRKINLYRIILNGIIDKDIKNHLTDLESSLKSRFHYIEIVDNTKPNYDLEKIQKENINNIIGRFVSEMIEKGLDNPVVKDALYYGLEALLSEKVKK